MEQQLRWPDLPAPYGEALRAAVEHILGRVTPRGIIVSGTIIRGAASRSSDLDIVVINRASVRQRIQRSFCGVPAEIFVNPLPMIERYVADERRRGRPVTAHMIATGWLLYAADDEVRALPARAAAWLGQPPSATAQDLLLARYMAASLIEDAADVAEADPISAQYLLAQALPEIVRYAFLSAGRYLPRTKDLRAALAEHMPQAAALLDAALAAPDLAARREAALALADHVLGARGFFAWDGEPEEV